MNYTVVGVFDRREAAEAARQQLQQQGLEAAMTDSPAQLDSDRPAPRKDDEGFVDSMRNFFSYLFGSEDDVHFDQYAETVRRGGAVVKVAVSNESVAAAARDTLRAAGAVDIDKEIVSTTGRGTPRKVTIPATGTAGDSMAAPRPEDASRSTSEEQVIPVVQEELQVGKWASAVGGVRVYAHTVERPVSESVELREEHAHVERRAVDRSATEADPAAFQDRTVEVRETTERPVVQNTARVVEEGAVGKDVTQRTEQVEDSVRETEVEVERLDDSVPPAAAGAAVFEDDLQSYRSDWQARHAAEGGAWDEYEPAYRYGHSLGSDQRYGGRQWDEIESDVRRDWERRYPDSAWERFKDSVRHGWARMTGQTPRRS